MRLDPPFADSEVHWRITVLCAVPDEVQMGGAGPSQAHDH